MINQIKSQEGHSNQQENNQKLFDENNYHPLRPLKDKGDCISK